MVAQPIIDSLQSEKSKSRMTKMESLDQKMDEESSTISIDVENLPLPGFVSSEIVASSIKEKLGRLQYSKPYGVCIYKVPEKFRKVNEEAYTPRLVSIGPLHRGKIHLQAMEDYKLACLHSFLRRFGVGLNDVIELAMKLETSVRQHYQDNITELSPEVFSEMIVLDCIFIVELFLKNYFPLMSDGNDNIFTNQWMRNDLLHDMMLLENQLPSIVPKQLFDYFVRDISRATDFSILARIYFKNVGNTANQPLPMTRDCYEARHLVEFLRHLHRPLLARDRELPPYRGKFEYSHSATELQEAGVKFKTGTESCLLDILFANGVLTIPRLTLNEWTETFFRNLIAFEQCQ